MSQQQMNLTMAAMAFAMASQSQSQCQLQLQEPSETQSLLDWSRFSLMERFVVPALPPEYPVGAQTSSTSHVQGTSTIAKKKTLRKIRHRMEDSEYAKMVAASIKKILQQSLNDDFRQECFRLMKVTNAEDAEIVVRNKLRNRIGLAEEIPASTLQERMQAARLAYTLRNQCPVTSNTFSSQLQHESQSKNPSLSQTLSQSQTPSQSLLIPQPQLSTPNASCSQLQHVTQEQFQSKKMELLKLLEAKIAKSRKEAMNRKKVV